MSTKIVAVSFKTTDRGTKYSMTTYEYIVPPNMFLETATHAVVDGRDGLTVVKVREFRTLTNSEWLGAFKPVVCLFDMSVFDQIIEEQERRKRIMERLDKMAEEELKKTTIRDRLADNPDAQELLS